MRRKNSDLFPSVIRLHLPYPYNPRSITPDLMQPVTIAGEPRSSGSYLLRIHVQEPLRLAFGRFRHGEAIALPAGDYVYVGSAMGASGSATLARRVLRHATRTGDQPAQAIRTPLLAQLQRTGLAASSVRPPATKRLHWHIDYLLDEPRAELTNVLLLCSATRDEAVLAQQIAADPATFAPAPGLGAADAPGATHFHGLTPTTSVAAWWAALIDSIRKKIAIDRGFCGYDG